MCLWLVASVRADHEAVLKFDDEVVLTVNTSSPLQLTPLFFARLENDGCVLLVRSHLIPDQRIYLKPSAACDTIPKQRMRNGDAHFGTACAAFRGCPEF